MMNPLHKLLAFRSRDDLVQFASFVGVSEKTGKQIALTPEHKKFLRLLVVEDRVVLWAYPSFGKSSLLVLYALWLIGRDPSKVIIFASGTHSQSKKLVGQFQRYVENNARLRMVFPHMAPGRVWTQEAASIAAQPTTMKDPNVLISAPDSGAILGTRADHVLGDDLLHRGNTRSENVREELERWWYSTPSSRLNANGQVALCGTVFNRFDLLHHLAVTAFESYKFPLLDDRRNSTWPEIWTPEAIAAKKAELVASSEFERSYQCIPLTELANTFKLEWVESAIERGTAGSPYRFGIPPSSKAFLGIDPAFSQKPGADETAFVVTVLHADNRREIVEVQAGRWNLDQITQKAAAVSHQYKARVIVEANGGGAWIHEALRSAQIPSTPVHTNASNKEARIAGLIGELETEKWTIHNPKGDMGPQVKKLVDEILEYDPEAHTGDRLSALLLTVEAVRLHNPRPARVFTYNTLGR